MNTPTLTSGQYLTFGLGTDTFAVEIAPIREIIEYPGLTSIPMTPSFIRGVINLRGAVVPVIDLSVRFGRAVTGIDRRTCIVIIEIASEGEMQSLGILVDRVNEVLDVSADQIEPRPGFGLGVHADFVKGMIRHGDHFVVILDTDRTLSATEMAGLVGLPDVGQDAQAVLALPA
ncbi:chemotaxis protein CheW [Uliginosibacterium sp. H3]|uniref:Chemotaxis protein CheW n=1 Tax=Uliginosibacterium silvisoli TaxID=3114758 RepID=A0ABU6K1J5_9RHOO|nr:chemotaxis protein CheW [Uliginosibacterium sp. H3]